MKGASLLAILLALAVLTSCTRSKPFDSEKWKSGDSSTRGDMLQDVIKRNLLIGKSQSGVQDLLERPDFCGVSIYEGKAVSPLQCGDAKENWYAYTVVTVWPRPSDQKYFCLCKLEIKFDDASKVVDAVAVR
jgi:hypothetical protein